MNPLRDYTIQLSETRRQHSALIKRALEAVSRSDAHDGLARLQPGGLLTSHGHTFAYVQWVLEAASKVDGLMGPRDFARTFLERPHDYSKTKAGIAAVMLEMWLARRGSALFRKFVETVVDKPDSFMLVFEGPLTQVEFDKMASQTEEFVKSYTPVVLAGAIGRDNMVSDLTIFEVVAVPDLTADHIKKAQTAAPKFEPMNAEPRDDERKRENGLRPESQQDYERVLSEGGLSSAAVSFLFPARKVLGEVDGTLTFTDPNGVPWTKHADHWFPSLTPVQEAQDGPPGLRRAPKGSWQSCQTCAAFEHPAQGHTPMCDRYDVDVSTNQLCDSWDGRETGADTESTRPIVRITVNEAEVDQEPEPAASRAYEQDASTGVVRSPCGSWALFESPVEGGPAVTIVVAESGAWALDTVVENVVSVVDDIARCYDDSTPWHRDRCIEHALAEMGKEEGRVVENVDECIAVARVDESLLDERDRTLVLALVEADPKEKPADKEKSKDEPKDKKEPADKEEPKDDASDGPPAPPPPPEPTDRMDEPEFYRDDLQNYYDVQLLAGVSPEKAQRKTVQKFGLDSILVTPTGEVRSPGVVDRPSPPPPPMVPGGPPMPPAPLEQPDGAPDTAAGAVPAESGPSGAVAEVAAVVASWAKRTGKSQEEAERLWKKAGDLATKNYPDLTPESEDWYRVKMGIYRRVMGVAAESRFTEPATIDDAFHRWVRHADSDDFGAWLADNHPKFLPHLSQWMPADLHESGRGSSGAFKLTPEQQERYGKWRRLLNMTVKEVQLAVQRMSEATTSLSVGGLRAFQLGRQSSRRLLAMRSKPVTNWDEEDWSWCSRQLNSVSKLRAMPGPLVTEGKPTEKLLLLRAWGHEPRVRSRVSEREVLVGQRADWRCRSCHALVEATAVSYDSAQEAWVHSCGERLIVPLPDDSARRVVNRSVIDVTPGSLPCLIAESDGVPAFADLKAGRVELEPGERDEVMSSKAVWHHGPQGKASPAVWKSVVDGRTHYVTNTHRAFNVAATLKGAIGRYHSFIKGTA